MRFPTLLQPSHIGQIATRNRIIKTAAGTSFWSPGERRVTAKALAYYEAVARGGVGLIMMESPVTEYPFDEPGDIRMRLDDDRYIEQISELVQVIQTRLSHLHAVLPPPAKHLAVSGNSGTMGEGRDDARQSAAGDCRARVSRSRRKRQRICDRDKG